MTTLVNNHLSANANLKKQYATAYPQAIIRHMPRNTGLSIAHLSAKRATVLSESANEKILTEAAAREIALGTIPDLTRVCRELNASFSRKSASYSALQFVPILQQLPALTNSEIKRFLKNPKTSHKLVQNDQLKIVLIHWEPGQFSSIHGHARGGCVFKVLHGRVEEKRYTPDAAQQLLAVSQFESGAMAYIDDEMAYHAVGNPFDEPAISIHAYTPGH